MKIRWGSTEFRRLAQCRLFWGKVGTILVLTIIQFVEKGFRCFRIDPSSALRLWAGGFRIAISTTFLQKQGRRKSF